MGARILFFLFVSIMAAPACAAEAPMPPPIAGQPYRLVQNWDFGESIHTDAELAGAFHSRFVYEAGKLDNLPANKEWQRYRDVDNRRLTATSLLLIAKAGQKLAPGAITSGMLRSRWTGKYGYFECRMKVPKGRGLWSACWLNPEDGKWPPEIDIVELLDNGSDTTKRSFHIVIPGKKGEAKLLSSRLDQWSAYAPGFDYADGFHTFAVEWTPDTVRHYVDSVLIAERRMKWEHKDGSDGGPAHFIVNLAVGGTWPGPPTDLAAFPAALEIDYMRVWQK